VHADGAAREAASARAAIHLLYRFLTGLRGAVPAVQSVTLDCD